MNEKMKKILWVIAFVLITLFPGFVTGMVVASLGLSFRYAFNVGGMLGFVAQLLVPHFIWDDLSFKSSTISLLAIASGVLGGFLGLYLGSLLL